MRVVLAISFIIASLGFAQTAHLNGTVRDAQGVISGVQVKLSNGLTTNTDDQGNYRFDQLPRGTYRVTFARAGFSTAERTVTPPATLDVTLTPEGLVSSIEVTETSVKATASRMEVSDLELPAQVSAIPQAILQTQGVNDLVTALRNVSGATAFRAYGMYEYYTVRGFSGSSQGNVVLVDGMRLEGNRLNTQMNNVERVEVLKGPSSILYGGSALSGAINLVRKKPQSSPAYEFFYRGGRFNTHQFGGGATGQIKPTLFYRVDTSFEDADAWRQAGARRFNVSPSVTWLASERAHLTLTQSLSRDRFDGDAGVPVGVLARPGFDLSTRFNTPSDFAYSFDSQTNALFTYSLPHNFLFRNSFLYRFANDQYYTAESLTDQPALDQVGRQFLYFYHHRRPVLNQADITGSFDLFGIKHTVLTGYEYQDYYNFTHRSAARSVATTPLNLTTRQETHLLVSDFPLSRIDYFSTRTDAFYWQDQMSIGRKLFINVGGRFDNYRNSLHNDPWANGQMVSRTPDSRRHQKPYTYRAGVVYTPAGTHQFYASSSSSFQPVTQIPADGRELKSETGRSAEVGHRWQGFQGRFQISTAFYQLVRKNVVIALPNQQFDQAGQQSSKGVDLDLHGNLGQGISLIANYGYTLPRYDDYLTSNGTVNLSGFRPRFTQKHAANLWLTKQWKHGFRASTGVRYVSSMYTADLNDLRLGGYSIVGGAVGYQHRFLDWSINAENLLNRQRYFSPGQISNQVYPGQPINIFTTLRFRFR